MEVEYLKDTSSSTVIKKLKKIFSCHGIPQKLCSDNGPEFKSKEFQRFAMQWDIKHKTSSPHFPQSNGLAERSVQMIKTHTKEGTRIGR